MPAVPGMLRGLGALGLGAATGSVGMLALAVSAPAPAAAEACSTDTGVTVVVDFNQLGGGSQGTCVSDGGGATASDLFPRAGFPLDYARRQPGFVCHVSGKPASDPCQNTAPANAYWGLWWSRGDAGSQWIYSSEGAASLNVPDGGLVAFAWDQSSGNVKPDADPVRPSAHQSEPSPSPSPSPQPSQQPSPPPGGGSGGGGGGGGNGSGGTAPPPSVAGPRGGGQPQPDASPSDSPSASPSAGAGTGPSASPGDSASASPSGSASPTPGGSASADPDESEYPDLVEPSEAEPRDAGDGDAGDGLPGWVPPLAVGGVLVGAGAAIVLRRRLGAGS